MEKGKIKRKLKALVRFFANPRLLLCVGLAWIITNGWAYAALAVGTALGIGWLAALAGGYLAFLWMPCTPEKILTAIIAIFLLRILFPKDEKTLAVLTDLFHKAKAEAKSRLGKKKKDDKDSADELDEDIGTREHVENIRAMQRDIEDNICPRCGKKLVLRQGRSGEFYGCSGYPECKFTKGR
jgi:hypothetical protein